MGGDSGNMGNVENIKRVVFVGNPNVGKSSMFNALLGARTRTMNAPGTTVSITCGQYRYKSSKTTENPQNWQFVDTPGTYSLSPMSPDEQVAVDALTGASGLPVPDLVVVVVDATALSRSLYLLSMVVELGLPTVVALTMNDLAARNGCDVDTARLSLLLDGMPVVAIDGRTGDGGKALADAIDAAFQGTPIPHGLKALPGFVAETADATPLPSPKKEPPRICVLWPNRAPTTDLAGPPAYCAASTCMRSTTSPCPTASTACCCTP